MEGRRGKQGEPMIKLTKLTHSCFYINDGNKYVLVDPGVFSSQHGSLSIDKIDRLDAIAITHEHMDHCDPLFIKELLRKFPNAQVVTNPGVKKVLEDAGVEIDYAESNDYIEPFEAPHENVDVISVTPQNRGYHIFNKVTTPGDSHSFNETKEVLAMPFIAPWGTIIQGTKHAIDLRPKKVFSVHDWFFSDGGKGWLKDRLVPALGDQGIEFLDLKDDQPVDL